jgi:hypothetical protein
MAGVERRPQQYFTPLIHTLHGAEAGAGLGGQQALIHHPTGNPNLSKRKAEDKGKGPWVCTIQGPVTNSSLLGRGVLPRTQTCMDAGLCCRHGGRGREVVTGPGGLLGTCSCQLCTNSPTSSVTFPAGKTGIMMRWVGSRAEGSEAEAGDKGEPFGRSQPPALPPYAGFPTEPVSWKSRLIKKIRMSYACTVSQLLHTQ